MQAALPRRVSVAEYLAFCRANPDLNVERTAEGEIVIVAPAGGESSHRSLKVAIRLGVWAEKDGRGEAFDSSVQFMLPDGSGLSPGAAWVSHDALERLAYAQRREFLALVPEFIVEVRSPSDRLKKDREKMDLWIANGVQLAWLIDADRETVHVYRADRPVEIRRGISKISGDGPVAGFTLDLRSIWKGLR